MANTANVVHDGLDGLFLSSSASRALSRRELARIIDAATVADGQVSGSLRRDVPAFDTS